MSSPATDTAAWSIGRLIDWTRAHLESKGVDDARLCAELLLAHAMDCPKIQLYARYHESPTDEQKATFRDLVKKAAAHTPIAYLIGAREFYSLPFKVTPDVLIPRPETELLVEHPLAALRDESRDTLHVLDIGTGSGCLAITIAKREPRARVLATDVSEAALAVARENADRHGVADRVTFAQADLFGFAADLIPPDGFDLIVSNPPYVAESERESLPANVRDYEPALALFAGENGLDIFDRIAAGAAARLRIGGRIFVEIGENQADAVQSRFIAGGLTFAAAHRDLAGTLRVLHFMRAP